ncbi:hypothetical protein ACIRON_16810 [Nocardioides sp. NPDC101246]|uniref:hypothetical protein n=1 Tax=Nocardioides sp. NPDC101246 TaxID=3364336 RepID=UPI0037F46D56
MIVTQATPARQAATPRSRRIMPVGRLQWWFLVAGGHTLTVLFIVGWFGLARFFPPPSPELSATAIAQRYAEDKDGIRLGATLMFASFALWAGWGAVIITWVWRRVSGGRILAIAMTISLTIAEMVGVLCAFFWAMGAFRPGEVSADITMTLNDAGWLMFVLPWPPWSFLCICLALAIFRDRSSEPTFPRWVGYVSLLTALLFVPAGLPLFFKSSEMAYDGVLGMYVPFIVFFVWVESVTWAMGRRVAIENPDAPCDQSFTLVEEGVA